MPALTAEIRQSPGAEPGLRSLRHLPTRGLSRARVPRRVAEARLRRRHELPRAHPPRPQRRAPRPAVGAIGHRHRHQLQHAAAVLDRDRRSRRGADRALRLGRRLSRGRAAADECALAVDASGAPGAVRGLGLRRHRPDPGTRLCAARRHRLDRQAHLRDQRQARVVDLPVDHPVQPAARSRSAGDRSLRHLHQVPRRLPDRRDRRAVRARRTALPVVPDDRAEEGDPRRARRRRRRLRLRLRHLPGRLPVEPGAAGVGRAAVAAAARARRAAARRPVAEIRRGTCRRRSPAPP